MSLAAERQEMLVGAFAQRLRIMTATELTRDELQLHGFLYAASDLLESGQSDASRFQLMSAADDLSVRLEFDPAAPRLPAEVVCRAVRCGYAAALRELESALSNEKQQRRKLRQYREAIQAIQAEKARRGLVVLHVRRLRVSDSQLH